ncbi:transcription elongation protein SprT [Novosphingobium sp. FKTRR1]|uniref:transcription elongation protein SprT n=1 Tax=Novosphingobium sp. FKTRR1 TaxID=2879118 RepID=UPI001CF0724F|nr:transcription elongation protein SprT [Novosphingobium sp. FKTRR1]
MTKQNSFQSRDAWLEAATNELRPHYKTAGYPLPKAVRFSVGFPSTGRKGKRIGEHWHAAASADAHHEIFIRADQSDPAQVLGILAHELVHSAVPVGSGHGPVFKKAALAVGLEGKMTQAMPGAVFAARLAEIAAELGPLPHGRLNLDQSGDDTPKKQGTRMLKAECETAACGYTVRITRKWLDALGAPCCPAHGAMEVEGWTWGEDAEDGED